MLDLVRAYHGTVLRPWQWAAGLLAVAAVWRFLGERGLDRRARAPWALLALFLVPTYVDHARLLDRGDSLHYYMFLRSPMVDGDLRFENDYHLLGWPEAVEIPNVLPVGAPILWSPAVFLVHGLRHAARAFGLGAPSGAEPLYQATVAFATLVYGTAALFLLMAALRRWVRPWAAFWATVVAWVASPLRFYLSVLPGMAHGVEFFAAVLVLRASLSLRDRPDARRAALAGAACGLAFLTRSQDGLLLLLPGILLALALGSIGLRSAVRAGLAMVAAFAAAALPQVLVWQAMFGSPFLIPHRQIHGDQFLHAPQLLGALVGERGGAFASYPALLIALAGLVVLARRDWRYVAAVAPALLATWYLNASVFDWYQVRRYTGLVPLVAPGLAVAVAPIAGLPIVCAALAFVLLRYDVAVDTLRSVPGDPAPPRRVLGEMKDGLVADAYALVEPIAPAAAARLVGRYTGVPPVGREPVRIEIAQDWVTRLPVRARNLSAPAVHDGMACRWVRGDEARIFVPVAMEGPVSLSVRAAPADPGRGTLIAVAWNATPLGELPMADGWGEYLFDVPAGATRSGTSAVVLTFRRGEDRRREVRRSAAVASLALHPGKSAWKP